MKCRYCGAEIVCGDFTNFATWYAVNPAEIGVYGYVECPTTTGEVTGHQPVIPKAVR